MVEGSLDIKGHTRTKWGEKAFERMGEMKENEIPNLAYGSNLNLGRWLIAVPQPKLAKGCFRLSAAFSREDNAYATIEPKRGSKVPVLWELQPEDVGTGLLRRLPQDEKKD